MQRQGVPYEVLLGPYGSFLDLFWVLTVRTRRSFEVLFGTYENPGGSFFHHRGGPYVGPFGSFSKSRGSLEVLLGPLPSYQGSFCRSLLGP